MPKMQAKKKHKFLDKYHYLGKLPFYFYQDVNLDQYVRTVSWADPDSPSFNNATDASDISTHDGKYKNPAAIYNSPVIHTVTLQNLKGGAKYYYQVAGSTNSELLVLVKETTKEFELSPLLQTPVVAQ